MRLGQKLFTSLFLGLSLLMTLVLFLVFQNLKQKNEAALKEQVSSFLQVQYKQLLQINKEWNHLIEVLLQDLRVQKWQATPLNQTAPSQSLSSFFKTVIHSQHDVVESIFIVGPTEKLLMLEGVGHSLEATHRLLQSIPKFQKDYHSPLSPSFIFNEGPKIIFLMPFYQKGALHSILGVQLSFEIVKSLLHDYLIENLEDSFILADDQDNIIVQFPTGFEYSLADLNQIRLVAKKESISVFNADDLDLIVGLAHIPQLNLRLYSMVDSKAIWKNTEQAFFVFLIILTIAGIFAGWIIMWLINRLLERPLSTLIQVVKDSEQELTQTPAYLLERNDEFGALAVAFSKMQEQIWGRITSLKSLNQKSYLWMEQNDPEMLLQLALASLKKRFHASLVAYYVFTGGSQLERQGVAPESASNVMPRALNGYSFWKEQSHAILALVSDTPLQRLPESVGSLVIIPMKQRDSECGVILCCLDGIVTDVPGEELDYAESLARMMQVARDNLLLLGEIKKHSQTLATEVEARTKELAQMNQSLEQRVKEEVQIRLDQDEILIQQSKMAEMGEMISLIAHQWRQPLGSIGSLIANLNVQLEISEVPKEIVQENLLKLNEQTQFLAQTVTDFRNFLRPNPKPRVCSLQVPIENSLKILDLLLAEGLVKLQLDLKFKEEISTFPNEITQVLIVLVKNSLEAFQEKRTENPVLLIRGYSKGTEEVIEVQDNAGGLPEMIQQNLFTPYQTTKEKGTGLGLYICQIIIERHCKGRITAENREEGTCFVLSFPHKY